MKYGELKIECLKVMDELNDSITLENLSNYEDNDSYVDLFRRIPGSINRAMDRIANRKKLPLKTADLVDGVKVGNFVSFDLSNIPDFRSVKRVSYIEGSVFNPSIDYIYEGLSLLVKDCYSYGALKLIYYPQSPAVSDSSSNDEELDIPDEIARIIPYYVKSDLLAREEAALAASARNKFESILDELSLNEEDTFNTTINKVYRI